VQKKEKDPLNFFSLSASRAAAEEKEKKLVCACVWYSGKERIKRKVKEKNSLSHITLSQSTLYLCTKYITFVIYLVSFLFSFGLLLYEF
jgi:hypothetical protein